MRLWRCRSWRPPSTDNAAPSLLNRVDLIEAMVLRINGLTETVLSAHEQVPANQVSAHGLSLAAKGVGTMEFDMAPQRREAVMQAGEAA